MRYKISQSIGNIAGPKPGDVEDLLAQLENVYSKLEQHDSEYTSIRRGSECARKTVASSIGGAEKTVLVEYFLSPDHLYVFVIEGRKGKLRGERLALKRERVDAAVSRYCETVANPSSPEERHQRRADLDAWLLGPVSPYLREAELVVFVPTRGLHYLPFHTLHLDGEPLTKHCAVVYSPSSSVLPLLRRKKVEPWDRMASFGIEFEDEATRVAKIFDTTPYLGAKATLQQLRDSSRECDVLHLSCHGRFDDRDPLSSLCSSSRWLRYGARHIQSAN